uniref:Uncharacterized protein n=1 Tax=Setaria digitata TaxID=48799 RepID=A0A915Q7Q2_9BILA
MSRGAACASYDFTICFVLLILLQSTIAIPTFYSRKLTLRPEDFLLTYVPSGGLPRDIYDGWSGALESRNDHMEYVPFQRLTRNTGAGDEVRYQIRHVGDLPMFRFG